MNKSDIGFEDFEKWRTSRLESKIIKPSSLLYSDFHKTIGDFNPRFYAVNEAELLATMNIKIIGPIDPGNLGFSQWENLQGHKGPPYDAEIFPIHPTESELLHMTGAPSLPTSISSTNVHGDSAANMPTYLKTEKLSGGKNLCGGGGIELVVDTEILLRFRNIFHDPEGLIEEEYKQTYFVLGGIPAQAIKCARDAF